METEVFRMLLIVDITQRNIMYEYFTQTLGEAIFKGLLLFSVVTCNSMVAYVWLLAQNRRPVTILLSIIALSDTLTILFGSINTITAYIAGRMLSYKGCYVVMVSSALAFVFHAHSVVMTTYLAVQRFVICAFPFSGPRICGLKSNTICAIASFVIFLAMRIPDVLIYGIDGEIKTMADNSSVFYCNVKYILDEYTGSNVLPTNTLYFLFFVLHLSPAIIITFCITVCLLTINRKTMVENQNTDRGKKARTTIMLVLIMFLFVAGECPKSISVFYRAFFPSENHDTFWLTTAAGNGFCNITLVISYLLNIWVYIGMSQQFRESLRKMVCRCGQNSEESKIAPRGKHQEEKSTSYTNDMTSKNEH